MSAKLHIRCKPGEFTARDLSAFIYSLNSVYALIALRNKGQIPRPPSTFRYFYFLNVLRKLPKKESLWIDRISKKSPLDLVFGVFGNPENLKLFVEILLLVVTLEERLKRTHRHEQKRILTLEISHLTHTKISDSDLLVSETIKLTKREIKLEEIERL